MAQVRLLCCWVFMSLAAAGLSSSAHGESAADAAFYSKLQEKKYHKFPVIKGSNAADDAMDLNDYGPYDPSPNSRSRIHSGPIYHNTPLNPRIPKSPPHLKGRKKSTAPSPLV